MDFVRSCYVSNMVFYPGGPLVNIRWFFAPNGAELFPGINEFCSANWDDTKGDAGILGEQGPPRPWSAGTAPRLMSGEKVCDPVEWYRYGQPPMLLGKPTSRAGVPICCSDLCHDAGLLQQGHLYDYVACGGIIANHGVKRL